MREIDLAALSRDLAAGLEIANHEPVIVTADGERRWVVLPYDIFAPMRRASRRALNVSELSDEAKKALAEARVSDEHEHLNALLDDDEPPESNPAKRSG